MDEILITRWPRLPRILAGEIIKQILKRGTYWHLSRVGQSWVPLHPQRALASLGTSSGNAQQTRAARKPWRPRQRLIRHWWRHDTWKALSWGGALLHSPVPLPLLFLSVIPCPPLQMYFMCLIQIYLQTKGSVNAYRMVLNVGGKEWPGTFAVYSKILFQVCENASSIDRESYN